MNSTTKSPSSWPPFVAFIRCSQRRRDKLLAIPIYRLPLVHFNTYTVTTLGDITLSGHTDIRVPNNATEELREHENGHDRLNKHEYEQRAKRKMEDAFRRFVGSSFVGEGETDADRQEDARTKAAEERDKRANRATDGILKQMDTLNGKYDKLTEHGTSDDIDTAEGETQAKEEQDKAPKAGDEPKKPDESEQDSGAGDSPGAFFDDETQELSIGGNLIMDFATDPSDSILGRGEVRIEPLVLIGVQENATVLLSDTRLQIVDGTNEDVLLDGFVFEVAYMPSTVPGYAGMIQGYLDIPPPWADGIVNPIASAFLAGMQHASDVGDLTMLWFYVDHPLFDEEGQSLIPGTGVTGTLKMGVAEQNVTGIPTVSEWAAIGMTLLLLTAGTIVFFRGRHNKTAAA